MILVDTSVWVDYFRAGDDALTALLERAEVLAHPWVIGELALGRLAGEGEELALLGQLPRALAATDFEMMSLIRAERLGGSGVGYVDAQLIASTRLTHGATLWTADRRLSAICDRLGIGHRTQPR